MRVEDDTADGTGAIEVTGTLQRQAWADGVLPPVENVRPGLWSVPVPIPANPLRYVLVYVLELDDGIALVDAGWPTDDAWQALDDGLTQTGHAVTEVRAVLVTHIPPAHFGLAGRVRDASGAWVGMHPEDAAMLDLRYESAEELVEAQRRVMAESGIPETELAELAMASMWIRDFVQSIKPDVMLQDGDRPDLAGWDLQAVWTPGHSPGHLCFYDAERKLLLSGDHVLPRISPNISLHYQSRDNPLADFLDSLEKVRALSPDEVLPAHEYRFRGLGARVDQLASHHAERLREIEDVLAEAPGSTSWEVTLRLTWSRPWEEIPNFMRRAANGETLAHLTLLRCSGRLRTEGDTPILWSLAD